MKSFGSILQFSRERNADLLRALNESLGKVKGCSTMDIYKMVAESPAARFWVSEERAANIISILHKGLPLPPMRENKKEMFMEIYRRAQIIMESNPGLSIRKISYLVVHQPAPKFYMTPRTAQALINRIRNGSYEKYIRSCQKYPLGK